MQSIDLIETDASGTSKDLVSEKEENKCNNINKTIQKTINVDDVLKEETKEHSNWSQIPDPYIILRIRGSASGKRNLLSQQPNIGKVYLYAKDPYEAKYQFLIHNKQSTGLKHFNDFKAFIEYCNNMDDIYKNTEEYSPNKKQKVLIVFNDMVSDMLSNRKLTQIGTELFIRGRKLNISLVSIKQSYLAVPKILD